MHGIAAKNPSELFALTILFGKQCDRDYLHLSDKNAKRWGKHTRKNSTESSWLLYESTCWYLRWMIQSRHDITHAHTHRNQERERERKICLSDLPS